MQGALRNVLLGAAAAALVAGGIGPEGSPGMPPAWAGISGQAVTNAKALLRYGLPIECKPIRQIQRELEGVSEDLRVPGGCWFWGGWGMSEDLRELGGWVGDGRGRMTGCERGTAHAAWVGGWVAGFPSVCWVPGGC